MKTPRELLFNRHRSVQPKLDAMRAEVVRGLRGEAPSAEAALAQPSVWLKFWQEVILPARAIWMGSAAVWCVIGFLHSVARLPETPALQANVTRPSLEMIMAFQSPDSSAASELKPVWKDRPPGPRSEGQHLDEGKIVRS